MYTLALCLTPWCALVLAAFSCVRAFSFFYVVIIPELLVRELCACVAVMWKACATVVAKLHVLHVFVH